MPDQTDDAQAYAAYCQAAQEDPSATAQDDQYQDEFEELLPGLVINHRNSRSLYNAYRKGVLREGKGSFPRFMGVKSVDELLHQHRILDQERCRILNYPLMVRFDPENMNQEARAAVYEQGLDQRLRHLLQRCPLHLMKTSELLDFAIKQIERDRREHTVDRGAWERRLRIEEYEIDRLEKLNRAHRHVIKAHQRAREAYRDSSKILDRHLCLSDDDILAELAELEVHDPPPSPGYNAPRGSGARGRGKGGLQPNGGGRSNVFRNESITTMGQRYGAIAPPRHGNLLSKGAACDPINLDEESDVSAVDPPPAGSRATPKRKQKRSPEDKGSRTNSGKQNRISDKRHVSFDQKLVTSPSRDQPILRSQEQHSSDRDESGRRPAINDGSQRRSDVPLPPNFVEETQEGFSRQRAVQQGFQQGLYKHRFYRTPSFDEHRQPPDLPDAYNLPPHFRSLGHNSGFRDDYNQERNDRTPPQGFRMYHDDGLDMQVPNIPGNGYPSRSATKHPRQHDGAADELPDERIL